jgi:hypothetical protein
MRRGVRIPAWYLLLVAVLTVALGLELRRPPSDSAFRYFFQHQGKRRIPFVAGDHEVSHGRNITWMLRAKQAPEHIRENWTGTSWIVEVMATGSRDGKPFQATHL